MRDFRCNCETSWLLLRSVSRTLMTSSAGVSSVSGFSASPAKSGCHRQKHLAGAWTWDSRWLALVDIGVWPTAGPWRRWRSVHGVVQRRDVFPVCLAIGSRWIGASSGGKLLGSFCRARSLAVMAFSFRRLRRG